MFHHDRKASVPIQINSPENFDGEERDVIVFMAPKKRLLDNTILTRALVAAMARAKYCTIICGHIDIGPSGSVWQSIVADAECRQLLIRFDEKTFCDEMVLERISNKM